MVTVVDAFRFFTEFENADFLADRKEYENDMPEGDERNISDLFVDQLEFANVIIINKVNEVTAEALRKIKNMVKTMNPTAKIFDTNFCKIDVEEIVGTGCFSFDEAVRSAGWLHSIKEMMTIDKNGRAIKTPKPETLEYAFPFLSIHLFGVLDVF